MQFGNDLGILHKGTPVSYADVIRYWFASRLTLLYRHKALHFTVLTIILKFLFFFGMIATVNASSVDFIHAFFGIPPVLVYLSFIGITLSPIFLFKGRAQLWALISLNLLITALMIADLMYYRGFGNFISPRLMQLTPNLDNLSASIVSMLRPIDVVLFLDIIIQIIMWIRNKDLCKDAIRSPLLALLIIATALSYMAYDHYMVDVVEKDQKGILFMTCWAPNQTMFNLSPIGYHLYDYYTYLTDENRLTLSPQDRTTIQAWFKQKQENLPSNSYQGMFKGKNLIVLQVESLENFVIDQKVDNQEITPTLNGLLKNSLHFTNFYEQVWNGTTSDAELMANTSVYPVRQGTTFFRFPDNTYNSMPKLLGHMGYNTIAMHPDKGSYWNWMKALTAFGFQRRIDVSSFNVDETIGLGISDGSYLRQAADKISYFRQPFYTFMITLTSHAPFDLPPRYRELNLPQSLDSTRLGGYFQSIHYTDEQIGLFLAKLNQAGILNNSVVVIYGDHSGVHKFYQDEVENIKPAENWWLQNNNRDPLIVYQKGMPPKVINTIGGEIDLLPTIAYLMGVNPHDYSATAMGRNLLNTDKNFVVLANRTFIGQSTGAQEKTAAINGIDIADKIIRSNYFALPAPPKR